MSVQNVRENLGHVRKGGVPIRSAEVVTPAQPKMRLSQSVGRIDGGPQLSTLSANVAEVRGGRFNPTHPRDLCCRALEAESAAHAAVRTNRFSQDRHANTFLDRLVARTATDAGAPRPAGMRRCRSRERLVALLIEGRWRDEVVPDSKGMRTLATHVPTLFACCEERTRPWKQSVWVRSVTVSELSRACLCIV